MSSSTHFLLSKSVDFSLEKSSKSDLVKIFGVASTENVDRDGEVVRIDGIDYSNLDLVNWNHMGRLAPDNVIGRVSKAYKSEGSLMVHADLYSNRRHVKTIASDISTLSKGGSAPNYGFSLEGVVTERDPYDKNIIRKCAVTELAITLMPANTDTIVCLDVPEGADRDEVISKSYKSMTKSFHSSLASSCKTNDPFLAAIAEVGLGSTEEFLNKEWSKSDIIVLAQSYYNISFAKAKEFANILTN